MLKKWHIQTPNPQKQLLLSDSLKIHPIIAQLLINRGICENEEARQFLWADVTQLHDPFLLKGMEKAKARLLKARDNKEKVMIFGDYDVDGVTSSAILNKLFTRLGIKVVHFIPHRLNDGYGLNIKVLSYAKEHNVTLLVAVDCGITALEEVDHFNENGIEVIIIDHHEPSHKGIPKAVAIINPKQKDCSYPFKYLASVGLVSKLVHAFDGRFDEEYLDLVALGTIADIVPLRGENRILVQAGLPKINATRNFGLSALIETARIKGKRMSPHHVGFVLGPRINASGRMDSAHKSLELFLSEDMPQALLLAQTLETHNQNRQKMQRDLVQEALDIVDEQVNFKDSKVIVVSKNGWHKGILGIVASRIADKYYRPTIVISLNDGVGVASCRSIDGFHLYEALSNCSEVLEEFGGHEGAAGLTIKEENIDAFKNLINIWANEKLSGETLVPALTVDAQIPLSQIDLDLAKTIEMMEPFGEGNPLPLFCTRQLKVKNTPLVLGRDTLKMWVTDGEKIYPALGFGMAEYKAMIQSAETIDLVYTISIDEYNKNPSVQLNIKDIKLSEG